MSGTLEVTIISARQLKSQDGLFGSNDPYCIIKLGGQKFKTEVKKDAGKECQWNQTFQLGITEKLTELKLEVYDQDPVADDTIGKTAIPLGGVISSGFVDAWYTIGKGSKSTGEIHVLIRFKPGSFPHGFDPNAVTLDDGLKVAAGVAGGALAAAALGYGAKMAYDHYNKKPEQNENHQPQGMSQNHGSNNPGYSSGSSHQQPQSSHGGQQYGGQPPSSYGSQPYGGQQQGGYGGQPQGNHGQPQGGYGGQQQGGYGGQHQGYGGQQQGGYGGQPQSGYGNQSQGSYGGQQGDYKRDPSSGPQGQQFSGGFMMPPGSGGSHGQ